MKESSEIAVSKYSFGVDFCETSAKDEVIEVYGEVTGCQCNGPER